MTSADSSSVDQKFLANAMASFIQIGAVLVLLYWCFQIVSPFMSIFVWAVIISVAVYPAHVALTAKVGGRKKTSATIIVLIGLAIIIVPTWYLADSTIGGLQHVAAELEDGAATVPPPNDSVAEWPVIGEQAHEIWSAAATNLEATLNKFEPQLKAAGEKALSMAGSTVSTALQFILSVIIAGVLLMSAESGKTVARNTITSLVGTGRGPEFTELSILTVRSVAKGVLGTALIQALVSAVGLAIAGIPAAGLWAFVVLVLAIIQLPPLLILGPIAIWYFSVAPTVPAVIFLIFAIIVSASDAVLKPMLLGRGVDTPMLVILIGAIGGAIASGIIGLFTGAVILALGYEVFMAWMVPDEAQGELADSPAE
jgi:predicted PurR-regulated permease PerM